MDMNDIVNNAIHSQEEMFGWLASLENYDKVTIERRDGNKIEAIARREIGIEEMNSATTIRFRNSMWFTNVRVNGKELMVKNGMGVDDSD
ncbi:hypothetical protein [Listeria rocourtiae]|uniref:hypothetical protein n=1 Tax=Listeria rocourtiae TaxID=647910 RepID=UPI003D2F9597